MRDGASVASVATRTDGRLIGDPDVWLTDVTHDSRDVRRGSLFVAIRGFHHDGHDYLGEAVKRGADAVCVQFRQEIDIPQVVVEDGRVALGKAAAAVHHDPSHEMDVVGVTGTNGKTTVTRLLEAVAGHGGRRIGVIGTMGARIGGRRVETKRTTPEASDLQRLLREMATEGVDLVAIEVSSHALALHRADEVRFLVAAFTNLGRDHLDFHGDVNSYFAAKQRLFHTPGLRSAAVWIDDTYGEQLAEQLTVPTLRVSRRGPADVWATGILTGVDGSAFAAHIPGSEVEVSLQMGGDFNIDNALMTAACAHLSGIDPQDIAGGMAAVGSLPGRFELVSGDRPVSVIVDYAHTPDGIRTVLASGRALSRGKLVVVFGAGGDRDRSKRPLMGEAAAGADVVVVTSDNPRSEDPAQIAAEVAAGAEAAGAEPIVELDRRQAIRHGLDRASEGDLILILGKGHEQSQEIGGRTVPFDDRVVTREELGVA